MKMNLHKYFKYTWIFLLVVPLLVGCDGGGVTNFFIGLLIGVGKWISQTVIGSAIENTVDYLVSFLNPDSTKLDYWGALTGTHSPLEFKISKAGTSYTCLSPNPTKMIRESVQAAWKLAPNAENFVSNCMKTFSNL